MTVNSDKQQKNNSTLQYQFASDNYAGICPVALEAITDANNNFAQAYGNDRYTQQAADTIRNLFETDCEIFFVFNGTAANALAISALCNSYHSVICHKIAHIETDECGGPEFFTNGTKLLTVEGANGKIDITEAIKTATRRNDIHFPKPRAISITQSTETGTVYSVDELQQIQRAAEEHDLRIHMDGARFANAVASLGISPKEITWKVGVDVLCFGGTKNGMAIGEAIVFFNKDLAHEFDYRCKQTGQLASKMRYLSAQWTSMVETGTWLLNAERANSLTKMLYEKLIKIPQLEIAYPCEANAVFLKLPVDVVNGLRNSGWLFYDFIGTGYTRLMCSWDTREEKIESIAADIANEMKKYYKY